MKPNFAAPPLHMFEALICRNRSVGVSLMSHPAKLCSTIKQACTQLLLAGLKVVQFCDKFVRVRPSLARRDLAAVFVYAKAQLPLFVNKIIEFYKALKYATAGLDAGRQIQRSGS